MQLTKFSIVFLFSLSLCRTIAGQPATRPAAGGLDSLNDDRLMNELAVRGLDDLLNRAFEVNKIPPGEQDGRRAILQLQELSDAGQKMSAERRQELLSTIPAGIERALPKMRDPDALLQQARTLIDIGVSRDVNTLEYWGENLAVMGELRPVAQAVGKIFERAAQLAGEQVNAIADHANPNDAALMAKLDKLDQLQSLATYSARMNDYAVALSMDAADPQRKIIADQAIEYLHTLDTEDQPVRPAVHLTLAKLQMVKGDYEAARKLFDETLQPAFKPAPSVAQIYEAKYFRAVTDVLDKKPDAAKAGLADLVNWQEAHLPTDPSSRNGAAAAAAMLEYRIALLQADLSSDAHAKADFNTAARAVLLKLQSEHPEFRAIISQLIIARLPADASMKDLDPLMLDALVRRGVSELQRPEAEKPDSATLERAVAAAKELIDRKGSDPNAVENGRFVLGLFLQTLGRDVEAINAFLDYVAAYPSVERAAAAMQYAESEIVKAKKSGADDSRIGEVYDRFLPLAINPPYNRKVLALEYARRLQLQNKPKEALRYFAEVPADDKRLLSARFYEMIATKQVLEPLPPQDVQRAALQANIQKLADEVNKLAADASAAATDDTQRQAARSMIVRTKLLAAELARVDQKDAQRAITLLADFEKDLKGLPNESAYLSEALLIRVQSLMALGKYNDAAEALKALLSTRDAGQGVQIVYTLLLKLDADFDKASQAGDKESMRTLAKNRASLSDNLVDWAKNNSDPRIKKFTYRYTVYQADTKLRAAQVEDDPAEKKKLYDEALGLYANLETPEQLAAYRETLGAAQQAVATYDPAVERGVGLAQYDLGNYAEAQKRLARLLSDGRLGSALMEVNRDGETRTIDNDVYWEAVFKLIRSNLKLNADADEQKRFLKGLYVRWGDRVGGQKWKDEFTQLSEELIPDFKR